MKTLALSLAVYGAAVAFSLSPLGAVDAQSPVPPAIAAAPASGNWTLRQREDWLNDRLAKSHSDGSLDRAEFERASQDMADLRHEEDDMRAGAQGQLTDNQTADLEARLDAMAARIHWANMNAYARPW